MGLTWSVDMLAGPSSPAAISRSLSRSAPVEAPAAAAPPPPPPPPCKSPRSASACPSNADATGPLSGEARTRTRRQPLGVEDSTTRPLPPAPPTEAAAVSDVECDDSVQLTVSRNATSGAET